MSWTQRLGNLGRFSPFTRSPPQGSNKVSDADFSYITADDLRRHQAESMNQHHDPDAPSFGHPRDTDVLILRNKKQAHAVHFPAYSIPKGELTIGQVRDATAKKVQVGDARRIKLFYKGKNLKDDSRTCIQEGLEDSAELMCTIAEDVPISPSDSDDSEDEFANGPGDSRTGDGEAKRRRNRGKKSKRRKQREERDNVSGTSTPQHGEANLGVPIPSRNQSPRPPGTPATPFDKLNALHEKLQSYMPDCEKFLAAPPTEPAKRDFEHKRLTETILQQVLLMTDGVDTDGDPDARQQRKDLVRETQAVMNRLDAAVKS